MDGGAWWRFENFFLFSKLCLSHPIANLDECELRDIHSPILHFLSVPLDLIWLKMSLYGDQKDEFVTSLAALALYDGDAEITSENIATLLAATNNTVAPYWPVLFAGLLKNGRIETLVFSGGAGGGGGAAPAAGKNYFWCNNTRNIKMKVNLIYWPLKDSWWFHAYH